MEIYGDSISWWRGVVGWQQHHQVGRWFTARERIAVRVRVHFRIARRSRLILSCRYFRNQRTETEKLLLFPSGRLLLLQGYKQQQQEMMGIRKGQPPPADAPPPHPPLPCHFSLNQCAVLPSESITLCPTANTFF